MAEEKLVECLKLDDVASRKKDKIITWNEKEGIVFCKYKRKSKSKGWNGLGIHYTIDESKTNNDFDSPWLKKCAGCYKNISRNREDDRNKNKITQNELSSNKGSVKPFESLSDIIDKNNILITKKYKELNEDTKMEDVREAEFLLWLNYICVNKENFVWENFDELVNKWSDIDKVTITAMSIFKYNNNIEGNRYKKIFNTNLKFSINEDMNEMKRILITLIITIGLLPDDKYVNIEINKKFIIELEIFKNETSNRRKIDYKNYTLLKFLHQIISEKKLQVNWSHNDFEDISDFNVKIEGMKKELMKNASSMLDIGIIWSNILVDEYNLRWNNFIIEGCYRKWAKDLSYLNNKAEMMLLKQLEQLFVINISFDINWQISFMLIRNEIKVLNSSTSAMDTQTRVFRIKNFIQSLPTYDVLYQRRV
ncbi:hypothetical protein RirG_146640 [Rhizophagus irregularis DAOM 197198w]|uniref:Uncharacterized protein n=2 Tax=Rhizophagus irregularis TaxID=588596 RepID=A0A015JAW2_RHIIW|nr:hypothetical protein RirG_146640 [Rhizophagus irregularis DAOM 197198w]